jgi:hypothetical protein
MDFLTAPPFALSLDVQDEYLVQYEGQDLRVQVFHDKLSYELDVCVARICSEEELRHPYHLAEAEGAGESRERDHPRALAATTVDAVRSGLDGLASALRRVVTSLVDPSDPLWDLLAQQRASAADRFGADRARRETRQRALQAWRDRDYASVVDLYSRMSGSLTPVEKERLRLAIERS